MSPVKENMPICWMMWDQLPGVPLAFSAWYSPSRMERIRSDIVMRLSCLEETDFDHKSIFPRNLSVAVV